MHLFNPSDESGSNTYDFRLLDQNLSLKTHTFLEELLQRIQNSKCIDFLWLFSFFLKADD